MAVHNDEFEISLSRELNLCNNTIQRIKKSLAILEQKHNKTTEIFIEELGSGKLAEQPGLKDDYDAWLSSYESLKRWEELERQYRETVRKLNRSSE
jgi:hypothetical protein